MSSLSPPPVRPAAIDPSALRLVLFGMPDAGKSSLLGALSQAAETQERVLHGQLSDVTQGLAELRHRIYEDRQRETQEEIVPYPVRFSPYGEPSQQAVLFDCDGRAANALLTQKRSMAEENREGTLAGAVLAADALILTVDASAPPSQFEDDFREFLRFLRFLEQYRGREHAVGGLPVYLVLTKCDLLARDASISRSEWEHRIAERQRDVAERFKAFLAGSGVRNGQLAFGTIDLEVRATAVRKPALIDASPQSREPFGVAELFHAAFEHANVFRERRARSHRRMVWTVAGAGGFLGAMLVAGVALLLSPQKAAEFTLADRVESLRASEGPTAATRLGPNLERRMKEWLAIQSDPGFPQLQEDLQTLVRARLDEGNAYIRFRDDVAGIRGPDDVNSLAELTRIESQWAKTSPPSQYAQEWSESEAVKKRDSALKEIADVRQQAAKLSQLYFTRNNRANQLLQTSELTADWEQGFRQLVGEIELPLPSDKFSPAGTAFRYEEVKRAYSEWRKSRKRLWEVFELATALGMLSATGELETPLAPRVTPPDTDITAAAAVRWRTLRPSSQIWALESLPDAIRPEIAKRVRRSLDLALKDGQQVVLQGLASVTGGNNPTSADWSKVGDYLLMPSRKEWREFVAYLAHLAEPKVDDPVETTAAFLRQTSFEISPKQIKLRIPDTLSDAPVKPAGDLLLIVRKLDTDETARVSLRQVGEPERDRQSLVYTFTAVGNTAMTYRPGDYFAAELPAKKGTRAQKLTWASSRTPAFQFEKLMREPRLHEPEQSAADGLQAVGATVTVADGNFPTVPAMMPAWPPEKK